MTHNPSVRTDILHVIEPCAAGVSQYQPGA